MKTPAHIPEARLKAIEEEIARLKKAHARKQLRDPRHILLDQADFLLLFKIGKRTSFAWRKKGLLPFHVVERRIYFRLSDIENMLDKCRIPQRTGPKKNPKKH